MNKTTAQFAPLLLEWWKRHGRHDLPWQSDLSLYRVWVSEIMLQQTQVTTVLRYYDKFVKSFPSVVALAAASEDEVLHHWSGLGYYSRARNLHKAAKYAVAEYGGEVPNDFEQLVAFPGIGRSTAGAILALTENQCFSILDGNAKRVLARLFAVEGWTGAAKTQKVLWEIAEQCTPQACVNNYTQAIMDLGATLCTRSKPDCVSCPAKEICQAFIQQRTAEIPASKPKRVKPQREVALVLAVSKAGVLLQKRPPSGIWAGLWSFPELDESSQVKEWCMTKLGCEPSELSHWAPVGHSFSHFDLQMHPVEVHLSEESSQIMEADHWLWYNSAAPANVGLAAPVARLLEALSEQNNISGVKS